MRFSHLICFMLVLMASYAAAAEASTPAATPADALASAETAHAEAQRAMGAFYETALDSVRDASANYDPQNPAPLDHTSVLVEGIAVGRHLGNTLAAQRLAGLQALQATNQGAEQHLVQIEQAFSQQLDAITIQLMSLDMTSQYYQQLVSQADQAEANAQADARAQAFLVETQVAQTEILLVTEASIVAALLQATDASSTSRPAWQASLATFHQNLTNHTSNIRDIAPIQALIAELKAGSNPEPASAE